MSFSFLASDDCEVFFFTGIQMCVVEISTDWFVELEFEVRVLLLLYILVLLTLLLTRIPVFVRLYLVYTGSALVSSFSRGELH